MNGTVDIFSLLPSPETVIGQYWMTSTDGKIFVAINSASLGIGDMTIGTDFEVASPDGTVSYTWAEVVDKQIEKPRLIIEKGLTHIKDMIGRILPIFLTDTPEVGDQVIIKVDGMGQSRFVVMTGINTIGSYNLKDPAQALVGSGILVPAGTSVTITAMPTSNGFEWRVGDVNFLSSQLGVADPHGMLISGGEVHPEYQMRTGVVLTRSEYQFLVGLIAASPSNLSIGNMAVGSTFKVS
jgi:hypothetical protein